MKMHKGAKFGKFLYFYEKGNKLIFWFFTQSYMDFYYLILYLANFSQILSPP